MTSRRSPVAAVMAGVLSGAVLMAAAPPASCASDRALVARTTALLSAYQSLRRAAAARRVVATASHAGSPATSRIAAAPAPGTVDAASASGGDVWSTILRAASDHRIPVRIILAVIATESAFDPRAVSHAGARGLMQVMPATARELGVDSNDLFDPCVNVRAGTRYMRLLADSLHGRTRDVLAAYNAGPKRVLSRRPLPRETVTYLRRVETHYANMATGLPPVWRVRLAIACSGQAARG